MSTAKKNQGRNPAALANDSPTSRLVQKFLEMKETDYTRSVVIPVLEAEGFQPVDFHHGATEIGKDLIFFRNKGFGRRALVVAVVKTDKLSKTSSDPAGFPVVLVQVMQAAKNKVLSWDGTQKCPDEVLVILADDPSHDILTSSPDHFRECLEHGVTFIHGTEVAQRLLQSRRDIAEQILQSTLDATKFLRDNPTNIPLLHALNSTETVDVERIFTELDAAVGATTISGALLLTPSLESQRVAVSEASWMAVSSAIRQMEALLGPVLLVSLVDLERDFATRNAKAKSQHNKEVRQRLGDFAADVGDWKERVNQTLTAYSNALNEVFSTIEKRDDEAKRMIGKAVDLARDLQSGGERLDDACAEFGGSRNTAREIAAVSGRFVEFRNYLDESLSRIRGLLASIVSDRAKAKTARLLEAVDQAVKNVLPTANELVTQRETIEGLAGEFVQLEDYKVDFDIQRFASRLNAYGESLVSRFTSSSVATSREYARTLLEDTKNYLSVIDEFSRISELASVLAPTPTALANHFPLGACVLGLIDSGMDVLLRGNAGSGKSTTLEMLGRKRYAAREVGEEVLFLPLARFTSFDSSPVECDPLEQLCNEVARLFRSSQPGVTSQFVREKIDAAKKLALILDGVDEAGGLLDWLVKLVTRLRALKGGALQVVASSRFDTPQLSDIGLFSIHLLPFRPEQVVGFVRNFLAGEPELADEVTEHLHSNPVMFSVAQTPLMSTILCVLARNGVALPDTMNALYKERFELLWGAYDSKKQIRRVRSSRSCLEDVSKKAAYFLHSRRLRAARKEDILSSVALGLQRRYRKDVIESAFLELERPCNVLVGDQEGFLGFGHLSYQEYLAADELYTSRQSDIVVHLADPWWRGALVLTAMKTDDIAVVIQERVLQSGVVGKAADTLAAMIEVCDENQRGLLRGLLKAQKRLDIIDGVDDDYEF